MKINLDQQIKTLAGEVMRDEKEQPLTLKWVCTQSLLAAHPKDEADGTEKMARFKLAYEIDKGGEFDLKAEDIVRLKKLVALTMNTLVMGQAWQMLGEG